MDHVYKCYYDNDDDDDDDGVTDSNYGSGQSLASDYLAVENCRTKI